MRLHISPPRSYDERLLLRILMLMTREPRREPVSLNYVADEARTRVARLHYTLG